MDEEYSEKVLAEALRRFEQAPAFAAYEVYDAVFDRLCRIEAKYSTLADSERREAFFRSHSKGAMRDALRRVRCRSHREESDPSLMAALAAPAEELDMAAHEEALALLKELVEARKSLSRRQQESLDAALEGLTVTAEAARANQGPSAVSMLRKRMVSNLRRALASCGIGPVDAPVLTLVAVLVAAGVYQLLLRG